MLLEVLLAGIVHSINNGMTVLSVSLELAATDGLGGDVAVLRRELTQMETVVRLAGALAQRSRRPEALQVSTVLELALALHALNLGTRGVACTAQVAAAIPPVRVPQPILLRLLLLMIDAARRSPSAREESIVIRVDGDASTVVISAPCAAPLGADARAFAASCGGALTMRDGRAELALPSLERLRSEARAEREVPAAGAMPTP